MAAWPGPPVANARRRHLEARTGPQGREIDLAGERLLNFCSNDYLGLANDARLLAAAAEALHDYGLGAGASALLSGWTDLHEALCERLARFLQRERALVFSSGYLANLGLLGTFADRNTEIFHDRLNHASLIDGVRLAAAHSTRYRHANAEDLHARLRGSQAARKIIVTDTVFSMDGDDAPIAEISALAGANGALLVCDDAHGFGVLGEGRGYLSANGLDEAAVPLVMVTFGKALGSGGAAVAGTGTLIDALLQRARPFIYDTALPPVMAAGALAGLQVLQEDPGPVARLARNVGLFRAAMAAAGLPASAARGPIQPVVLGSDEHALAAAAALRAKGFYVRAVRPPTVPEGTSRLRICLSAAHQPEDIQMLVAALRETLHDLASAKA